MPNTQAEYHDRRIDESELPERTQRELELERAASRDVPPGYLSDTRNHEGADYRGIK